MTEGQRVKLEEYLDEFEVAVTVRTLCDHPNALEVAVKATDDHRERILDLLDTIQGVETVGPWFDSEDERMSNPIEQARDRVFSMYCSHLDYAIRRLEAGDSYEMVLAHTNKNPGYSFEEALNNLITLALEQSAR